MSTAHLTFFSVRVDVRKRVYLTNGKYVCVEGSGERVS